MKAKPKDHSKSKTTKRGTVKKIIEATFEPEKAEISVSGAEDLYKELRIENKLEDENGKEVKLKPGAEVTVVVEADEKDTVPKS
jgi:hypothetical protein